jgi:adenylate kinase
VVVLRTDSTLLYDRLVARKYAARKIEENMDAEIMQVLLEEAREAYDEEIVVELRSDEVGDVDDNVERIVEWVERWRKEREQERDKDDEGREDGDKDGGE